MDQILMKLLAVMALVTFGNTATQEGQSHETETQKAPLVEVYYLADAGMKPACQANDVSEREAAMSALLPEERELHPILPNCPTEPGFYQCRINESKWNVATIHKDDKGVLQCLINGIECPVTEFYRYAKPEAGRFQWGKKLDGAEAAQEMAGQIKMEVELAAMRTASKAGGKLGWFHKWHFPSCTPIFENEKENYKSIEKPKAEPKQEPAKVSDTAGPAPAVAEHAAPVGDSFEEAQNKAAVEAMPDPVPERPIPKTYYVHPDGTYQMTPYVPVVQNFVQAAPTQRVCRPGMACYAAPIVTHSQGTTVYRRPQAVRTVRQYVPGQPVRNVIFRRCR